MERKLNREGIVLIEQIAEMAVDIAKLEAEIEVEKENK